MKVYVSVLLIFLKFSAFSSVFAEGKPEVFFGDIGKEMPTLPIDDPVNYLAKCLANPDNEIDCAIANDARRDGGLESSLTRTLETVTYDLCPDRPGGICVGGQKRSKSALRSVDVKIMFEYDKAILQDGEYKKLVQLAEALTDPLNNNSHFLIIGHTDSKGTMTYNCYLSKKRAQTVQNVLTTHGVKATNLIVYGAGEYLLRDKKFSESAENRRVGFALQGDNNKVSQKIRQLCQ